MTEGLLETGAWGVLAILAGFLLVNAVCMVLLPQAWFSLPRWLRLQGAQARNLPKIVGVPFSYVCWAP